MSQPLQNYSAICWAVLIGSSCLFLPDAVLASNQTPMGNVLCTVVGWFTGNVGKGLATIAITVIGVGALLGKVSWGMAMIVGIGVSIVFGAAGIVSEMGGGVTGIVGDGSPNCQ